MAFQMYCNRPVRLVQTFLQARLISSGIFGIMFVKIRYSDEAGEEVRDGAALHQLRNHLLDPAAPASATTILPQRLGVPCSSSRPLFRSGGAAGGSAERDAEREDVRSLVAVALEPPPPLALALLPPLRLALFLPLPQPRPRRRLHRRRR